MTKEPASVIFLDDSEDLRELMPILLKTALGVDCMCFASLAELEKQAEAAVRARVAILDINLGGESHDGVDALNWLKNRGFCGRIVFFTGHARTNPLVQQA